MGGIVGGDGGGSAAGSTLRALNIHIGILSFFLSRRDRSAGRVIRDMERGKDVDRERMVHHIQRERERDADREAVREVDKHFEESLKRYKHTQNQNQVN